MNKFQAALHHARKLIDSGEKDYICHALQTVGHKHPSLHSEARWLQAAVSRALVSSSGSLCPALNSWTVFEYGELLSPDHARLARLAWIDKLILEHA